jgi:23S rRNA (adenine2503-C2)-methyltransferase
MTLSLADHSIESLQSALAAAGLSIHHATRLLGPFYRTGGVVDLATLGLGHAVLRFLDRNVPIRTTRLLHRHQSGDGTVKLLVGLHDGHAVETVLMPGFDARRAAGCVSSQVGCAMRCDFCASTREGLHRDLTIGEIVEQYLYLLAEARLIGRRVHSLVFMGMGEPMHNLDAVIPAIERLSHPRLGAVSRRGITVSTVGVVPGIERLADSGLRVPLAISLHAPDDDTRGRIIPTNRKWTVADVVAAGRSYQERTGRIGTIEYTLLADVNDADWQADRLAELLDGWRVHVNLIPFNPIGPGVTGVVYRKPSDESVRRFHERLLSRGVVTHVRRTRGDDVNAACGQLRLQVLPIAG